MKENVFFVSLKLNLIKLTVNDVLFGYKGHSQPFDRIIRFIIHLILVARLGNGINS